MSLNNSAMQNLADLIVYTDTQGETWMSRFCINTMSLASNHEM